MKKIVRMKGIALTYHLGRGSELVQAGEGLLLKKKISEIGENCDMVFKPMNEQGSGSLNLEEIQERKMGQNSNKKGEDNVMNRELECVVESDPGTSLNESFLSKEQVQVLNTMVEYITGWHITPTNQYKASRTKTSDCSNSLLDKKDVQSVGHNKEEETRVEHTVGTTGHNKLENSKNETSRHLDEDTSFRKTWKRVKRNETDHKITFKGVDSVCTNERNCRKKRPKQFSSKAEMAEVVKQPRKSP